MPGPTIPAALRGRVRKRAANRCEYCQYPQAACYATFECDHVAPASAGGTLDYENLAWACPTCNASKRERTIAIDPASGKTVPLFNPRVDQWDEHFSWSADTLRIRGKTAKGRATVRLLRMNRRGVTIIRMLLLQAGLHPAISRRD